MLFIAIGSVSAHWDKKEEVFTTSLKVELN